MKSLEFSYSVPLRSVKIYPRSFLGIFESIPTPANTSVPHGQVLWRYRYSSYHQNNPTAPKELGDATVSDPRSEPISAGASLPEAVIGCSQQEAGREELSIT
jgi:hypothetical protein